MLEWGILKNAAASHWTKTLSMRLELSAPVDCLPHHVWRPNHLSFCYPSRALDQAQTVKPNSRSRKDHSLGSFRLELLVDPQLGGSFDHHYLRKCPRFHCSGVEDVSSRAPLMLTAHTIHEWFHCSQVQQPPCLRHIVQN